MNDGLTNKYSFEIDGRPKLLHLWHLGKYLISNWNWRKRWLKLKEKMAENELVYQGDACISRRSSLLTKFFRTLMMMLFFSLVLICFLQEMIFML
jgi:hypothetical protein